MIGAHTWRGPSPKLWQCGKDAANALADKIAHRPVTCEDLGRDRYKRIIAKCTVAGEDLGAWMVQLGLAQKHSGRSTRQVCAAQARGRPQRVK